MKGAEEYIGSPKSRWRKWVWRAAARRSPVPAEEAVALYLVGPSDLDREVAIAAGFTSRNLYAVDIDEGRARAVRRDGSPAIIGELCDVLRSWNMPAVDVLIADLCCGFHSPSVGVATEVIFGGSVRHGAAVALNMLRGRDPMRCRSLVENMDWIYGGKVGRHRGRQLALAFPTISMSSVYETFTTDTHLAATAAAETGREICCAMQPETYTYKSERGRQVFDSVVFSNPDITEYASIRHEPRRRGTASMRRQMAAIKATRTRTNP